MVSFHNLMRLLLITMAEYLIRWSNWHNDKRFTGVPCNQPMPEEFQQIAAQAAFNMMDCVPKEQRKYQ